MATYSNRAIASQQAFTIIDTLEEFSSQFGAKGREFQMERVEGPGTFSVLQPSKTSTRKNIMPYIPADVDGIKLLCFMRRLAV